MLIKNHWYAIELGNKVGDEPVQVRVHGHDLVLWRSKDGTVNSQSDLCVHRGGSLGGGRVVMDKGNGSLMANDVINYIIANGGASASVEGRIKTVGQ